MITSPGGRSGAVHVPPGSTRTWVQLRPASHSLSTREAHGAPSRTTRSGRHRRTTSVRTRASADAMAPGRRQPLCGVAKTGQPVAFESDQTASGIAGAGAGDYQAPFSGRGQQLHCTHWRWRQPRPGPSPAMPRSAVRPAQPEPPKGPGPVGACCCAQRRFDVRIGGSVGRSLEDGGGRTEQGLPEGQVEVDRPGTVGAAAGLGERPGRQRPPGPGGGQLGAPGCTSHRTALPKRPSWSTVWGAPKPWSSGGRSAVTATMGTPAWWASMTAGCSSEAAVPLVVTTGAGTPVARARPRAKNPAERSSASTWSRSAPCSAASARAMSRGVDLEPGQATASLTPARNHSSTSTVAKAA